MLLERSGSEKQFFYFLQLSLVCVVHTTQLVHRNSLSVFVFPSTLPKKNSNHLMTSSCRHHVVITPHFFSRLFSLRFFLCLCFFFSCRFLFYFLGHHVHFSCMLVVFGRGHCVLSNVVTSVVCWSHVSSVVLFVSCLVVGPIFSRHTLGGPSSDSVRAAL